MGSDLKLSDDCKRIPRRVFGASMNRYKKHNDKSDSNEKSLVEDRRSRFFGPRAVRLHDEFSTPPNVTEQAVLLDSDEHQPVASQSNPNVPSIINETRRSNEGAPQISLKTLHSAKETLRTQQNSQRRPADTGISGLNCTSSCAAVILGCSENGSLVIHGTKETCQENPPGTKFPLLVYAVDITGTPIVGASISSTEKTSSKTGYATAKLHTSINQNSFKDQEESLCPKVPRTPVAVSPQLPSNCALVYSACNAEGAAILQAISPAYNSVKGDRVQSHVVSTVTSSSLKQAASCTPIIAGCFANGIPMIQGVLMSPADLISSEKRKAPLNVNGAPLTSPVSSPKQETCVETGKVVKTPSQTIQKTCSDTKKSSPRWSDKVTVLHGEQMLVKPESDERKSFKKPQETAVVKQSPPATSAPKSSVQKPVAGRVDKKSPVVQERELWQREVTIRAQELQKKPAEQRMKWWEASKSQGCQKKPASCKPNLIETKPSKFSVDQAFAYRRSTEMMSQNQGAPSDQSFYKLLANTRGLNYSTVPFFSNNCPICGYFSTAKCGGGKCPKDK